MSVACECFFLSGRGLCDGPITRSESTECVCVCVCAIECDQVRATGNLCTYNKRVEKDKERNK
jgi:hypothetical protein